MTRAAWDMARCIEHQQTKMRPSWSATERSPDDGRRRRATAEATEKDHRRRLRVREVGHDLQMGGYHKVRRRRREVGAEAGLRNVRLRVGRTAAKADQRGMTNSAGGARAQAPRGGEGRRCQLERRGTPVAAGGGALGCALQHYLDAGGPRDDNASSGRATATLVS